MKKIVIIFIPLLIWGMHLHPQDNHLPAAFGEKYLGARPAAMGNAYTAMPGDPLALIWNPALLNTGQQRNSLIIEYAEILGFYEYSFIAYRHRLSDEIAVASGILHSGDEAMSESIGYISLAGCLGLLNHLIGSDIPPGRGGIGVTTKLYYASFGNNSGGNLFDLFGNNHQVSGSAQGIGFDAGMYIAFSQQDYFGMSFKNAFSRIKWESSNQAGSAQGSYNEGVPAVWTTGYVRKQDNWRGAIDITKSLFKDTEDILYTGLEYALTKSFYLRGGYSQELVTADNRRLAAGIGAKVHPPGLFPVKLSFAYQMQPQFSGYRSIFFSLHWDGGSPQMTQINNK